MFPIGALDIVVGEKRLLRPLSYPQPTPPTPQERGTTPTASTPLPRVQQQPTTQHPPITASSLSDQNAQHFMSDQEKIKVVQYSIEHGLTACVLKYDLPKSTVSRWKKVYTRFGGEDIQNIAQAKYLKTPDEDLVVMSNLDNNSPTPNPNPTSSILLEHFNNIKPPGEERIFKYMNIAHNDLNNLSHIIGNNTNSESHKLDSLQFIQEIQHLKHIKYSKLVFITEMPILKDGKGDNCRVVLDVSSQTGQESNIKVQEFRVYFAFNQEGFPFKPLVILEQQDFQNNYFQIEVSMNSRAIILSKTDVNLSHLIWDRWLAPIIRENPFGKTLILHNLLDSNTHINIPVISTTPEIYSFPITSSNTFLFPFNLAGRTFLKRSILRCFYSENMGGLGDNAKLMESVVEGLYNFDVELSRGCFIQFVSVLWFVSIHLQKCARAVGKILDGVHGGNSSL